MAQSFLPSLAKHVTFLSFLALLTACGGGSGGGSAPLPDKVALEFPAANQTITNSSQDFEVRFTNGAIDAEHLEINLNKVNVTPLFKVTATSAKASVYALSGVLKDGANNFLDVKSINPKSATDGVKFTYDATPEIVLTNATDAGVANGEARKATFDKIVLTLPDGVTTFDGVLTDAVLSPAESVKQQSFSLSGLTIPSSGGPLMAASPNFTLKATDTDGDTDSVTLVAPKAKIKYGAGLQLNSSAFNVLEKWVVTILEQQIPSLITTYTTNPHPVNADNFDTTIVPFKRDSSLTNNSICTIVNLVATNNYTDCAFYLTHFDIPVGAMTTDVEVVESSDPDSFILQVKVRIIQINASIDTVGYQSLVYQGAFIADMELTNVLYTVDVVVSKGDGIIKFNVPEPVPASGYTPYSFSADITVPHSSCSNNGFCAVVDEAARNGSLENYLSFGSSTLESSVLKTSENSITPKLNNFLTSLTVANKTQSVAVKDNADIQVSTVNFDFFGTVINESKTTSDACGATKVCGGFIGIGGSTYAVDLGLSHHNLALGSYFDPVDANSVVGKNNISSDGDVMIALSENSLNQLLLSFYQSRLLAAKTLDLKISDLGTEEGSLGKQIVDSTAKLKNFGYDLAYNDDIKVAFDLEAVPRSQFYKHATDSGLELSIYALRVKIDVYRHNSLGVSVLLKDTNQANTVNLLLDVKALLNYGLNEFSLPEASVDKNNVVINVLSLQSFNGILSIESVMEAFPAFLAGQIESFAAGLSEPIVSNVDLKGVGLVDQSWLVIDTLAVDEKNEFIILSTRVVDNDPTPKKGIFQLSVTDSCITDPTSTGCPP